MSDDTPRAAPLDDEGEFWVISFPLEAPDFTALTPTERNVARLVVEGLSNAEIASTRGVSISTIENQLQSIYRKLEIYSRAELAALVYP